ncbi:hypothetical protein DERP_013643 [Dermatophagoides pteronyssinus]|uniref:Uncharacterized protein n=1 Tax=Dermatophagoides pteronyssinus TaxID=6956 RepID=A0ABQ8IPU1_DERPT|nr:hypothetical protein DERP_013643 [Dermatophagoides pteronyssinus]
MTIRTGIDFIINPLAEIDRNIAANEGFLYISPSFNKRSVEFIDRTKRSRIILNSFKSLLSLARISLAKCSLTVIGLQSVELDMID